MTRYHFNLRNGGLDPDVEGTELADINVAKNSAVAFLGELIADQPDKVWHNQDLHVDVTDGDGLLLFTLTVLAIESPAMMGASASRRTR